MPNIRIALWGTLAAILFYGYQVWMHDYPATGTSGSVTQSAPGSGNSLGDTVPQAASSAAQPNVSPLSQPGAATQVPAATPASSAAPAAPAPDAFAAAPESGTLHVVTDVLDLTVNLKGGELDQADLLQYPLRKDAPHVPVRLLSREPPESLYLLQTGLIGDAGESAPTHLATWVSSEKSFVLGTGAKELRVPLTWTDNGLTVTKTFVFTRGSYSIDLTYEV